MGLLGVAQLDQPCSGSWHLGSQRRAHVAEVGSGGLGLLENIRLFRSILFHQRDCPTTFQNKNLLSSFILGLILRHICVSFRNLHLNFFTSRWRMRDFNYC